MRTVKLRYPHKIYSLGSPGKILLHLMPRPSRHTPYKIIRNEPVAVPKEAQSLYKGEKEDLTVQQAAEIIRKHQESLASALSPTNGQPLTTHDIRARIQKLFASRDYHPIAAMLEMVMAKNAEGNYIYPADFRFEIHKELAPYVAPKLKAMEVSGKVDASITINVVKFSGDRETKTVTAGEGPAIDV